MITVDEYVERRLRMHLRDLVRYYETKLQELKEGSETHTLIKNALKEAKETLAMLNKRMI
jgi:hypothetical protein